MLSVVSSTFSCQILSSTKKFKWLPQLAISLQNAAIRPLYLCSRIICTDCKLLGAASPQIQTNPNYEHNQTSLSLMLVKDNCKLVEHQYFKPVPTEVLNLEDLLKVEEFKCILARSSFSYDVNLIENAQSCRSVSSIYFYSYKDILNDSMKNLQNSTKEDKVYAANSLESKDKETKPTEQQLLVIIDKLTASLLKFFEKPLESSLYHENIVFHNNIRKTVVRGRTAYMQTMYLFKIYGFVQFANIKVDILKITHHTEDGTVRVRWRVKGVYRHKLLLSLWKLQSQSWKKMYGETPDWLDGFSVFSVGSDGLIYKHVCDKMTPSDDPVAAKQADLKSRLIGLLQLPTRSPAATIHTIVPCYRNELTSCKKLS